MIDFVTEERFRFILGQSWAPLFIHEAHAQGLSRRDEVALFVVASAEECLKGWGIDGMEFAPYLEAREEMAKEWDALVTSPMLADLDNYYDAEMRGEVGE